MYISFQKFSFMPTQVFQKTQSKFCVETLFKIFLQYVFRRHCSFLKKDMLNFLLFALTYFAKILNQPLVSIKYVFWFSYDIKTCSCMKYLQHHNELWPNHNNHMVQNLGQSGGVCEHFYKWCFFLTIATLLILW